MGETGDKPCQESQKTCFPVLLCGLFQHSINKDSSTSFHNFGDCKESSGPLDSLRKMKTLHSAGFSESLTWGCVHLQSERDISESACCRKAQSTEDAYRQLGNQAQKSSYLDTYWPGYHRRVNTSSNQNSKPRDSTRIALSSGPLQLRN